MGNVSILVNNASQREFNKFDDMSFDQWRFVLSINLDTLFHTCKAVIPEMKKNNCILIQKTVDENNGNIIT